MIEPIQFPLPRAWGMGIMPAHVNTSCSLGADVRPNSWDVSVLTYDRSRPDVKVPKLVFYGKVRDDRDLVWLCHQYPVRCGVVDCRPDTHTVARMIERLRKSKKDFWRAQYAPNSKAVEMSINEKEHLLTLHRTMALDEVFFAASSGMIALPENFREICAGAFAAEMCAATRVPVIERGEESWAWVGDSDHSHHSICYAMTAMKIGKMSMFGSSTNTTMRGAVGGSLRANSDRLDDDSAFIDPFASPGEPSRMENGALMWSDDLGGGF